MLELSRLDIIVLNIGCSAFLLCLIAISTGLLLRRASPQIQHNFYCFASCLTLISPLALLTFSQVPGLGLLASPVSPSGSTLPARVGPPDTAGPRFTEVLPIDTITATDTPLTLPFEKTKSHLRSSPSPSKRLRKFERQDYKTRKSHGGHYRRSIIGVWAVITVYFLLRLSHGIWRVTRIRRSLVPSRDARLVRIANVAFDAEGLLPCEIFECDVVFEPMTIGFWKPVVAMPTGLSKVLSDQQLVGVLTHEATHLRRRDTLIALGQGVIGALCWWNPLIWIIHRKIDHLRELICDDRVVTLHGEGRSLASAIVSVAHWAEEQTARQLSFPIAARLLNSGQIIEQRVRRLAKNELASRHQSIRLTATITFISYATLVAVTFIPILAAQAKETKGIADRDDSHGWAETAVNELMSVKTADPAIFIREASLILRRACAGKSLAELEIGFHKSPRTEEREEDQNSTITWALRENALSLSEGLGSLDLHLSAAVSDVLQTSERQSIDIDVRLVDQSINQSFDDIVMKPRYSRNSAVDFGLRCNDVVDIGLQWPLVRKISIGFRQNDRQEIKNASVGPEFDLLVEFAATKSGGIGGRILSVRIPAAVADLQEAIASDDKQRMWEITDRIEEISVLDSEEWWLGDSEQVQANKSKYLVDNTKYYGIADGGSNWGDNVEDAVPGISNASVSVIQMFAGPPEGVAFVVWSDLANSRGGSGTGSPKGGAFYNGRHSSGDRQIEFSAKTDDGVQASIVIAEQRFELAEGSVFLVSAQRHRDENQGPIIQQLSMDATRFPKNRSSLIELANKNDQIRRFFTTTNQK